MRKFTSFALLAFALLAIPKANAQTPTIIDKSYLRLIPDHNADSGEPCFYAMEYKEGNDNEFYFSIYDLDFNLIKEGTLQLPVSVTHEYTQYRKYIYKTIAPADLDIWGYTVSEKNLPIETFFKLYFQAVTDAKIVALPNGTKVIAYEFLKKEDYGEKYPSMYYMLMDDGYYHQCKQEYIESDYGRYGDYEDKIKESVYTESFGITEVNDMPDNGTQAGFFSITKGIFGKGLHYLTPILKDFSYKRETESYKEWGTKPVIVGFEVHNLDGETIKVIDLPTGYFQTKSDNLIRFACPNGRQFLMIDCNKTNNSEEIDLDKFEYSSDSCSIYRLSSDSKISPITTVTTTSISPRTPRKGEIVTVSLNDAVQTEGCVVNVVASDGRSMIQSKIPAGENTFTFNTAGFPQGVYVVTTSSKVGKTEAAKIIVR